MPCTDVRHMKKEGSNRLSVAAPLGQEEFVRPRRQRPRKRRVSGCGVGAHVGRQRRHDAVRRREGQPSVEPARAVRGHGPAQGVSRESLRALDRLPDDVPCRHGLALPLVPPLVFEAVVDRHQCRPQRSQLLDSAWIVGPEQRT